VDPHLTCEQLSARLGICVETLSYWRRHQKGPAYMPIGRHVRYRIEDVLAWEQSRLVTPDGRAAA